MKLVPNLIFQYENLLVFHEALDGRLIYIYIKKTFFSGFISTSDGHQFISNQATKYFLYELSESLANIIRKKIFAYS